MCYSGKCKYENYVGDCEMKIYNILHGFPVNNYLDDALCVAAGIEIEKLEQARKEAQNVI